MKWYKLIFKQVQPIHIGSGNYGVVSETRIFIPGWTMWGALTKTYNLQNSKPLSENQKLFENISCFYPSLNEQGNSVLFPNFKDSEFHLGNYSESKFRAKFVDTFVSTAIHSLSRMAKDESLHEIDILLPQPKKDYRKESEGQLYWTGIIGLDDEMILNEFLKQGLQITVGGDSRYGLGLMKMINVYDNIVKGELEKWISSNYLPVRNKNVEGKTELLIEAIGYKGANLRVKEKGFYYIPGSRVDKDMDSLTFIKGVIK
jgi:hypothetical protein